MQSSAVESRAVRVEYYAAFREQRGVSQEEVSTTAATPLELYAELQGRYAFPWLADGLRVAVNDEFCGWSTRLAAGDRVVFIAPVSGG